MSRIALAVFSLTALTTFAGDKAAPNACVKVFERQRACTDTFIPALVDLRVELDKPAGISERAKTEGKEALVSVAKEEWKKDSADAAIAKTCQKMAASPKAAAMTSAYDQCLAATDCAAFTACVVPLMRSAMK